MAYPATMTVLVIAGLLLILGVILVRSSRGDSPQTRSTGEGPCCPQCRHANDPEARFCARCGAALHDQAAQRQEDKA